MLPGGPAAPPQGRMPDAKKTVFTQGHRLRMNALPIILNLLLPWGVFTLCCALASFRLRYDAPICTHTLLWLVFLLCACSAAAAAQQRRLNPEPTWYSYAALMLCLAAALGTAIGEANFQCSNEPYYQISGLKTLGHVDASQESGQHALDAGVVYFAQGSRIDHRRSWHFKSDQVYCVAPVVSNDTSLKTDSIDFWVVGKDCCAIGASDFRCGDWRAHGVRSALRALDDDALPYYRLAVKQAEALYNIKAAHPLFFSWNKDPAATINSWARDGFRTFVFASLCHLLFSLIAVFTAIGRFALLGRGKKGSEYTEDHYIDAMTEKYNYGTPSPYGFAHGY